MKRLALAATAMVALMGSAHAAAPGPSCFRYHDQKVVLTGEIEAKTFVFDGKTTRYWVLLLDEPICTQRGQGEDDAASRGVWVIAVEPLANRGDPNSYPRIDKALHEAEDKRVRVTGVLWHSTEGSTVEEEIGIDVENVTVIPAMEHAGDTCYSYNIPVTLTGHVVSRMAYGLRISGSGPSRICRSPSTRSSPTTGSACAKTRTNSTRPKRA